MRPLRSSGVETIGLGRWWALIPRALPFAVSHGVGLARYRWFGVRGKQLAERLPPDPPQTEWIAAITDVLDREVRMSRVFRDHSERSWLFARALAAADGNVLDDETLYAACLLHDAGLFVDDRSSCFAMVGARIVHETAAAAGVDAGAAGTAELAVASHIDVNPRTQMARYLRAGTLLDVIGTFAWKIDPTVVDVACEQWSRTGFPDEARRRWNEECSTFPYGRAEFARRPGYLPELIARNPLPG